MPTAGWLRESPVPKVVIQGTADDICTPEALAEEYPKWADPKVLIEVPGATHFFHRQLRELEAAVLEGLDRLGIERTPTPS